MDRSLMQLLNDYEPLEIQEILETAPYSRLCRAVTAEEQNVVLVLELQKNNSSSVAQARFREQYENILQVEARGILKVISLQIDSQNVKIIHEDFEGKSLSSYLEQGQLPFNNFLNLASSLAHTLGCLHRRGIVHKYLSPRNILIGRNGIEMKLFNFGINDQITQANEKMYVDPELHNNLLYISPEQTGRLNRTPDYRTDLYSLGIVFYEMLTGRPPFDSSDPLEVIHFHIAHKPESPALLRADIPDSISRIVMKLLSRNVDDRYQNSFGLQEDLEKCLSYTGSGKPIPLFEPGATDVSPSLNFPNKLFGRTQEQGILNRLFQRTLEGDSILLLVAGAAGIGKSALITELSKQVFFHRGSFISGKFEKLKQNIPYNALLQALKSLIDNLLSQNDSLITEWRHKLRHSLGENGRIITDVLPGLESIIGPQPPVPNLGAEESRNRFNFVLRNFIKIFADLEHPLILFLDDLQWADSASLRFIKVLATDLEMEYILLIGAYRDTDENEVKSIQQLIKDVESRKFRAERLYLPPLTTDAMEEMLGELLRADALKIQALVRVIEAKTAGNPFFINQFIKNLYWKNLLTSDSNKGWIWDLSKIKSIQVTSNVLDLMEEQLQELPPMTQDVLKYCACLGSRFQLETLSRILERSIEELLQELRTPLFQGMLTGDGGLLSFAHDRIHEVIYSGIPYPKRRSMHLRIGVQALEKISRKELRNNIFYIVNQLNTGSKLLVDRKTRERLAFLNLAAGLRARDSSAFPQAFDYFTRGIKLLEKDHWRRKRRFSRKLFVNAAESAYLTGDREQMHKLTDILEANAKTPLEKVSVYQIRIRFEISQNNPQGALNIARIILKQLGVKLPEKPGLLLIFMDLVQVLFLTRGRNADFYQNLPIMQNSPEKSAANLLMEISTAAFMAAPKLYFVAILTSMKLHLKHGISHDIIRCLDGFALIMNAVLNRQKEAYRISKISSRLIEKFGFRENYPKHLLNFNTFIRHWHEHYRESLSPLKECYRKGMDNGDLEYSGYSLYVHSHMNFLMGSNLSDLASELRNHSLSIELTKHKVSLNFQKILWQTVVNFLEEREDPGHISGRIYDEDTTLTLHEEAGDQTTLGNFYMNKTLLYFHFGMYEQARDSIALMKKNILGLLSTTAIHQFYFYSSLIELALLRKSSVFAALNIHRKVGKNQRKLKKMARLAPMNIRHKYKLIEAEKARVQGNNQKAEYLYEIAIEGARENGYTHEEAMACELAGKSYLSQNKNRIAGMYIREAYAAYNKWGAKAKLKQLRRTYPQFLGRDFNPAGSKQKQESRDRRQSLDLATLTKSAQALSGEMNLERLLIKIMNIILENTGSQKGFLLLNREGVLTIRVRASTEEDKPQVLDPIPLSGSQELSQAVVHYVRRTGESLILSNAGRAEKFNYDPYIRNTGLLSVLCAPIVHQGKLTGIVYLENNLVAGAFNKERMQIVNMLSAQAAISIENAGLYGDLEEEVLERTRELQDTLEKVQELKNIQDADYYLTSLVADPLSKNLNQSQFTSTMFFIKQKKEFAFREWAGRLGGDVCFSANLTFKGRPVVLFMNGDAQGKSMQGAGGAIVAGTALNSIATRDGSGIELSPVHWLQRSYQELSRLFATFEGYMAITCFMGLLEEKTGLITFFNAEHPPCVLYRDGKAGYIKEEIVLPRIGHEIKDEFQSQKFQLLPGDVIFSGSDGKDELKIQDANGVTQVKSDEKLFLQLVEESDGELEMLEMLIRGRGTIIDDISILRLEWHGPA